MVFRLSQHDTALMRELAARAGVGAECVSSLKRRAELPPQAREGAPYVLLLGNRDAIRQLLGVLAGAELAKAVHESMSPVVVGGRQPQVVRPLVVTWPNFKHNGLQRDATIVLKAEDRIPEATLEALASLGTIELGILVSRLSQPVNQNERKLARGLDGVVETMRVAIIGHPAEEASSNEVAELANFVRVQMGESGFPAARLDGFLLWMGGAPAKGLPGEVAAPTDLLSFDPIRLGYNRDAALGSSLGRLLDDIEQKLESMPQPPGLPATEQDIERLLNQFDGHVEGLGNALVDLARKEDVRTTEQARSFLLDRVQSWINGQGLPAISLTLAERYRPGVKARIAAVTRAQAENIEIEPPPKRSPTPIEANESWPAFAFMSRLSRPRWIQILVPGWIRARAHHWGRVVLAVAVGLLAVFVAMLLLPIFAEMLPILNLERWPMRLAALAIGALLALAVYFVPIGAETGAGDGSSGVPPVEVRSRLKGWPLMEEGLKAAFAAHMRSAGGDAARQSIAELRTRLLGPRSA